MTNDFQYFKLQRDASYCQLINQPKNEKVILTIQRVHLFAMRLEILESETIQDINSFLIQLSPNRKIVQTYSFNKR